MALIRAFGNFTGDPLELAFDGTGTPVVESGTATQITIRNPDNNVRTTVTGTALALDLSGQTPVVSGTMTGLVIRDAANQTMIDISSIAWSFAQFVNALNQLFEFDNDSGINALLGLQPVTFDASARTAGVDFGFEGVTSNINMLGSNFQDTLEGGRGNDMIRPGGSDRGDNIMGSPGNDQIDLRGVSASTFIELDYRFIGGPVVVDVNSLADTTSISKGAFGTDTVLGSRQVIRGDGLNIIGTRFGDTYNIQSSEGFVSLAAAGGNDTFNINLAGGGTVRLIYAYGPGNETPTGAVVNLATGVVSNDRYGGRDQINVTGTDGRIEIQGSNFADLIIGSDRDERFILQGGNDTLDGGGGYDVLRYDRNGLDRGIDANLETGIITGRWFGQEFRHQVSNIEEVRGSSFGDRMVAANTGSRLEGRDGDDILIGGAGTDRLYGGAGNDYINPGDNADFDAIDTGTGFDTVDFVDAQNGFFSLEHWSIRSLTGIDVTIYSQSNLGTVSKGSFGQTTLSDVRNALGADGLGIAGTDLADTFDITLVQGDYIQLQAGRGADSYTINGTGTARLLFDRDGDWQPATQGLVINLANGTVSNDGFGFQDSLDIGPDVRLQVLGTMLADDITGSARDDFFLPLAGNDTIRGNGGFDTVSYDRSQAGAMRVDLAAGTAQGSHDGQTFTDTLVDIRGVIGSRSGNDTLKGSSDGNYLNGRGGNDILYGDGFRAAYAMDDARAVYRLYQATLDRAPDVAGQLGWTERLAEGTRSLQEVAAGFVNSPEFQNVYGALGNAAFVDLLYQNVLGRAADAGGLAGWVGRLEAGTARAQVVTGFSESTEFRTATNAAATRFTLERDPATWTDDVYRLYQATLARDPDLAGLTTWAGRLAEGTRSLQEVAAGFVGSPEFQNVYGALGNAAFVDLLYQNVLGRAADAGGLAGWLAQLDGGTARAQVVLGFSQSAEFTTATAPGLTQWVRAQGVHDVLEGGGGTNNLYGGIMADEFRFAANDNGTHRLHDFEAWDYLTFRGFGYAEDAQALARMTQQGADVVFADQGVTVILLNTQLAQITEDSIWI